MSKSQDEDAIDEHGNQRKDAKTAKTKAPPITTPDEIEGRVAGTPPFVAAAPCAEPVGLPPDPFPLPPKLELGPVPEPEPEPELEPEFEFAADGRMLIDVQDAAELVEAAPAL